VGVAIAADTFDKSIRNPAQVSQLLNADVLGSLPMVRGRDFRARLSAITVSHGPRPSTERALVLSGYNRAGAVKGANNGNLTLFEESIRTLHSSILLSDLDQGIRSLLVTSTAPGEGKSTTAVYLAVSNAAQGHPTLLVDADMRRPSLHKILGTSPATGLSNVLSGQMPWREAVSQTESHPNLHLLAAGPPSRRAPDLVARGLADLIDAAELEYSLIIIDSPPFLNFAEPLRMSTMVDGVLLVAVAGETNREAAASVLATLKRVRANVVGLVLNKVTRQLMENYHYYGSYGHYGKYYKRYYGHDRHESA